MKKPQRWESLVTPTHKTVTDTLHLVFLVGILFNTGLAETTLPNVTYRIRR